MIDVFKILQNGNWHSLKELAPKTKIELEELTKLCEKASKNGLIEYDTNSGRVRLGNELMSTILQIKAGKEKEARWEKKGVGTAILPAGKGFRIQSLWIRNETENDLEIKFTFNTKPKEIVISKA